MMILESPESSSPIVTRAVAAGLQGEYCDNYRFPAWQKALLLGLGALPQGAARYAISRFQSISGLPPEALVGFSINQLAHERVRDYAQFAGKFPTLTVGAALGGATTYLSLALGGPFLPQTFVVTLRGGSLDGNVHVYLKRSLDRALEIADKNPGLMTIQHFDPVHDGWLTRFVNHLRFKLLDLPEVYAEFIKSRLEAGGEVVYLEGGATWLRYRLGPRSVFQVGGWGGIPPEEFLEGSVRLTEYARRAGLKSAHWSLEADEWPLERGAESEWGSEPGLAEALKAFCRSEGYRFVRIPLPHPNSFSRLAFEAAQELLKREGRPPAGVLVEMFSQFDAMAALQGSLLPLWLIFNTRDSLEYLKIMGAQFPEGKPVFFSPLSTFSLTPDLVPFEDWETALSDFTWTNIGARPSHYPSDAQALVKWAEPLRNWVREHQQPILAKLTGDELVQLAGRH